MHNTIHVEVEGIGQFAFRERTMRDEFAIGAEHSRLTEGLDNPAGWLTTMAEVYATLAVLTVESPDDWDIDALDPLDPQSFARINQVYTALREREEGFRAGGGPKREAQGAPDGADDRVLVPPAVQSGADR